MCVLWGPLGVVLDHLHGSEGGDSIGKDCSHWSCVWIWGGDMKAVFGLLCVLSVPCCWNVWVFGGAGNALELGCVCISVLFCCRHVQHTKGD